MLGSTLMPPPVGAATAAKTRLELEEARAEVLAWVVLVTVVKTYLLPEAAVSVPVVMGEVITPFSGSRMMREVLEVTIPASSGRKMDEDPGKA